MKITVTNLVCVYLCLMLAQLDFIKIFIVLKNSLKLCTLFKIMSTDHYDQHYAPNIYFSFDKCPKLIKVVRLP